MWPFTSLYGNSHIILQNLWSDSVNLNSKCPIDIYHKPYSVMMHSHIECARGLFSKKLWCTEPLTDDVKACNIYLYWDGTCPIVPVQSLQLETETARHVMREEPCIVRWLLKAGRTLLFPLWSWIIGEAFMLGSDRNVFSYADQNINRIWSVCSTGIASWVSFHAPVGATAASLISMMDDRRWLTQFKIACRRVWI